MKFLFYYSDWTANADRQAFDTWGGVGYYRIKKVADQVAKNHDVDIVGAKLKKKGETSAETFERIFTDYDVFWTCYSSHAEDLAAMYYWRDNLGKKVVIDIDDNFWDIPESHQYYDKLKETKRERSMISTGLSFADIITVSTEPLKKKVEEHMKNVFGLEKTVIVVPNFNDVKDWKYKPKKQEKGKLVIGYAGSNSHYDDLKMVFPVIGKLLDKYENLHFQCIGAIDKKALDLFFSHMSPKSMYKCDIINASSTFDKYPERMAQVRWDIVIAPLVDSAFTRCKSHIKWMEYSMYKRPVIASRVYPYYIDLLGREIIKDGVSGMLVNPNEWEDALEELIQNPEKRKELGENAYNQVVQDWQYDDSGIDKIVDSFISVP